MKLSKAQVIDTETTTYPLFGRKASPFNPDNWIVAIGHKQVKSADVPTGLYYAGPEDSHGFLATFLRNTQPAWLVGHNIKFDLLHLLRDPEDYAVYQEWVAAGGLVWDTQLAEYLLGGMTQEHHTLTLEEVSLRYGGTIKADEVKDLWEQGVSTQDIPRNTLMRYLLGDPADYTEPDRVDGDIGNTERIFVGQFVAAQSRGMLPLMRINMGALLATVEMERNGMFVDADRGRKLARVLEVQIAKTKVELSAALPPDLPWEFNWGSRKQLSALIFGGVIEYPKREYLLAQDWGMFAAGEYVFEECFEDKDEFRRVIAYAQKTEEALVLEDGRLISREEWERWLALGPTFIESFPVTYKSGKNAGQFKTKQVKTNDLTKPKSRMGSDVWVFPRQHEPDPKWASAETGQWSTAEDVILEIAETSTLPWLKALGSLAKMTKDLGTYYITGEAEGKPKGLLTKVGPDSIIHHAIHMVRTVTARFSSSDPNLQNVPRGDTSSVKRMFTSRFGPQGYIIPADFTALEIYCQAFLTRDKQLIADLQAGLDMHCARLSTVENRPYEEVVELCKGKTATKEWKTKRTHIKVFSFQRAYGAGAAKIAAGLKLPVEIIQGYIEADEKRYPGITPWQTKVAEDIVASAWPTTKWAQHPLTKESFCVHRGSYTDFLGKTYVFEQGPAPDFLAKPRGNQVPQVAAFSPTESKNYPVQGLGGEIMKAALWLAVRAFYKVKNFGQRGLLVNTVHDAGYADAHPDVALRTAALLHACMDEACTMIEYTFGIQLPLPVPADTHWGHSMFVEKSVPGLMDEVAKITPWLRANFMEGFTPSWELTNKDDQQ